MLETMTLGLKYSLPTKIDEEPAPHWITEQLMFQSVGIIHLRPSSNIFDMV